MEDFLQKEILGNSIHSYLYVTGIILLALLIKRIRNFTYASFDGTDVQLQKWE